MQTDASFSTHWAASYPRIRAYVFLFIGAQHDAEDVIQETALAAAEDYSQYDPDRPFIEWVLGIARNRIRRYYQSRGRDRRMLFEPEAVASIEAAYQASENLLEDVQDNLEYCLERLPRRSRSLIEARYLLCLKPAAIAERNGTTIATIYTRLSQVRSALRECVERRMRLAEGQS